MRRWRIVGASVALRRRGCAGAVEALQDRQVGEIGEDGGDGLVEVEVAGLDQLQGGDGGDQLGEGGDPEDGVGRHRRGRGDGAGAIGGLEALAVRQSRGGDEAWDKIGGGGLGEGLIDGGDRHQIISMDRERGFAPPPPLRGPPPP